MDKTSHAICMDDELLLMAKMAGHLDMTFAFRIENMNKNYLNHLDLWWCGQASYIKWVCMFVLFKFSAALHSTNPFCYMVIDSV